MDARTVSFYAGTILTAFVGLACGIGAFALQSGAAANWPDVAGSPAVLRRTAMGLGVAAIFLIASAAAVFGRVPYGYPAALAALLFFVAGGFWGNYAVFGDIRPTHTITNAIIAAAAFALLWFGSAKP